MKKLLTILLACTSILSAMPIVASAENETAEIEALAESLGAYTDALYIKNYVHTDDLPISEESYTDYLKGCSPVEINGGGPVVYADFSNTISAGMCNGISFVEILAHNGVISPSDLDPNAETLSDITLTPTVDKYLTDYQVIQNHNEQTLSTYYKIMTHSSEELVADLVDTAERCMNEGKYFLITIDSKDFNHAVAGMGVIDGNWELNGGVYDKCVLILDSNLVLDGKPTPFAPEACIYVNSETNKAYMPAYQRETDEEFFITAFDDDNIMNYKGTINASTELPEEINSLWEVRMNNSYKNIFELTAYNSDGTEYDGMEAQNGFSLDEDPKIAFLNCEKIRVNSYLDPLMAEYGTGFDKEERFSVVFDSRNRHISTNLTYNGGIEVDDKSVKIATTDPKTVENYMIIIESNDGILSHFDWSFLGFTNSDIKVTETEDGIILNSSRNGIYTKVSSFDPVYDDDGNITDEFLDEFVKFNVMSSDGNIMIALDDSDNVVLYRDDNGDGVYDVPVEKGDVNSDGKIDATDASFILDAYSTLSTTNNPFYQKVFINEDIADFNGDGYVDATDASMVLAKYAESSTT
ncbi:MAG: hypothetical protein K2N27_05990 [Ruminococcus sp.]|nr:hypothetical protein [Ruminococcus sp.]